MLPDDPLPPMPPRIDTDWNFDRIHSAMSLINDAQGDMMRSLHRQAVNDVVQSRIVERLEMAISDIKKTRIDNTR